MNREVRKKLQMAKVVRGFNQKHPSADASHAPVLARLDTVIVQMEALAGQQEGGYLSKHSSSVRARAIRRRVQLGLLPHLVTAAADAAKEESALTAMYRPPRLNAPNAMFRTVARKLLEQGLAQRELLTRHGLSATLLEDLRAAMDEFDASLLETSDGKLEHVQARAELDALSAEVTRLVAVLDGINRYRFERDPELLVAWESAKHVQSGPQFEKVENPGTATGPAQGGPGEVQPAA